MGFDYRISTGLGKQRLLEGTNKTLHIPGLRRIKQRPHKRQLDLPVSVWESKVEARFNSGLLRGQGQWEEYSWRNSILTQVLLEDVLIRPNTEAIALA